MSAISIRLPEDLDTRLSELAETTGRTRTDHILEAIHEHLVMSTRHERPTISKTSTLLTSVLPITAPAAAVLAL